MAWVNANWNTGNTLSILGVYNTALSGGTGVQFGSRPSNPGEVLVWTWGGIVLVASGGAVDPVSNDWSHIAYTYDGTTHRLYVNGRFANSSVVAQQSGILTSIYLNGYPSGGSAETGDFIVDDISYYSRVLSPEEILTAYSTRGDKDGIVHQRVAGFLCNEGVIGSTVVSVTDVSGLLNSLTGLGADVGQNFTYTASYINKDVRAAL
jgi:hypothetical protein